MWGANAVLRPISSEARDRTIWREKVGLGAMEICGWPLCLDQCATVRFARGEPLLPVVVLAEVWPVVLISWRRWHSGAGFGRAEVFAALRLQRRGADCSLSH